MYDVAGMRTTVNIDGDVLRAAKELAALSGRTLGQVLSDLARSALARGTEEGSVRNGVPLLAPTPDARLVTSDDVARMLDEV
jgi:hypothetical protein